MATTTAGEKCKVVNESGRFRWRCRYNANGTDGLCTRHRNMFTPRPYTCRACGTEGLIGPSTCAEHQVSEDQP